MESVKQILRHHGYSKPEDIETGDSITVKVSGFMDLVVEKIGDHRVSVGHYCTQRGDLMSDPEIVFKIDGDEWTPVRYTQHPHIHEYNENGLSKVQKFITNWDQAIQRQGFVDAAKQNETQSRSG